MDNVKRTDVGYTYWIVSEDAGVKYTYDEMYRYIQSHGYSPGDGSTFMIVDVGVLPEDMPSFILPQYGRVDDIALRHTLDLKGKNYTLIDVRLDIADMTKYKIDKDNNVVIDGDVIGISPIDAAYAKGIQYNRGNTIDTFRKLTSYILSRYDISTVGSVRCVGAGGYIVRSVDDGNDEYLHGVILYER